MSDHIDMKISGSSTMPGGSTERFPSAELEKFRET